MAQEDARYPSFEPHEDLRLPPVESNAMFGSVTTATQELSSFIDRAEASSVEAWCFAKDAFSELERRRTIIEQRGRSRNESATAATAREVSRALAPLLERLLQRAEQAALVIRQALQLEALREELDEPQGPGSDDLWQRALIALGYHRHALRSHAGNVRKMLRHAPQASFRRVWRPDWEERYVQTLDVLDDLAETLALGLDEEVREEIERRSGEDPALAPRT